MPQSAMQDLLPADTIKEPSVSVLQDSAYDHAGVRVAMLRLDEIHPVISGNKLYKLYYFLQRAKKDPHKKIITFGGPYSSHLAATAFACRELNLQSVGVIRGGETDKLSHTLSFCRELGMQLEFISRDTYKKTTALDFVHDQGTRYGPHILIPEGGFCPEGKKGASLIAQFYSGDHFTHVCLPVGTATTLAGLVEANHNERSIIGLSVLKNLTDTEERFRILEVDPAEKYTLIGDYHFGGYAKKSEELMAFLNEFYRRHSIPLDFVYTGKMMFGIDDLIRKNYFPRGSDVLCIHTGGLQGNDSLPARALIF
jgi:1-aminocyclopropane-1-carboxylate deaminase/D-cysteine desulfhydrase-like pyridoxal-dependent ACC family enzyme